MSDAMRRKVVAIVGWAVSGVLVLAVYAWLVGPDAWRVRVPDWRLWHGPQLRQWRGMATHGSPAQHAVAITFDDGPDPLWAPLLADTLERHGAKGTFFVVGARVQQFPEITARLVRGGHQVSSHSMTHPYPNLTVLSPARVRGELEEADRVLKSVGGDHAAIRPPGGGVNATVIQMVHARGARIAWWTVNGSDSGEEGTAPPPPAIANDIAWRLRPGAVVLMHQRPHSVLALEALLARPGAGGYTYETFNGVTR